MTTSKSELNIPPVHTGVLQGQAGRVCTLLQPGQPRGAPKWMDANADNCHSHRYPPLSDRPECIVDDFGTVGIRTMGVEHKFHFRADLQLFRIIYR